MPGPVPCGHIPVAPLLPKLRGHFAEFLGDASPAGLGILSPSTCVGLRYGPAPSNSGFSRRRHCALRYSVSLRVRSGPPACGLAPCRAAPLRRALRSRLALLRRVPAVLSARGAGLFTCCPSGTPPGLPLGPDSPGADQLYPGKLGYSAARIPTLLSLLIPAFSLPAPPPPLSVRLRRRGNAPLPPCSRMGRSFGGVFQPRTFSARGLSASELLRTL